MKINEEIALTMKSIHQEIQKELREEQDWNGIYYGENKIKKLRGQNVWKIEAKATYENKLNQIKTRIKTGYYTAN